MRSVRVAPDILVLRSDVTMTEITKASANMGCATVTVMSFLPVPDNHLTPLRTTMADPGQDPPLNWTVLKHGSQTTFPVIVPAGGAKVFTHITFIPVRLAPAEAGATGAPIQSVIVTTEFFKRADCTDKDGEWPVTTVYEVPAEGQGRR